MLELNVDEAVLTLKAGDVVIVPTDTVYGIACDSQNLEAVKKIYKLKKRPLTKPLILLISSTEMLKAQVIDVSDQAEILIRKYWPGALSLIFKKSELVSGLISAGQSTIGVRIPNCKETLELIEKLGRPIVATSVNISGQNSMKNVDEIQEVFDLPLLKSSTKPAGMESTILDTSGSEFKLIREGAIRFEELKQTLN